MYALFEFTTGEDSLANIVNSIEHGHDSGIVDGVQGVTHDCDMPDAQLLHLIQITDVMLTTDAIEIVFGYKHSCHG